MIILKKNVPRLSQNSLQRFAALAAKAAGVRGEVNILVTSNRELQSLNRRFRGKNQPTDVLSFPAQVGRRGDAAGDIAISADMAAINGNKLGHSARQEIKILLLHGLLHLAGYDHERDNGTMARKEARLRCAFKLPLSLIERQDSNRTAPAINSKTLRRRKR